MDVPADFGLELAPGVRRLDGGGVLVGGAPLRIMRLSAAGRRAVDAFAHGDPVGASAGRRALARRLLDAAMANPRPTKPGTLTPADVTAVIPVKDDPGGLARTLAALGALAHVIVVDDGSERPVVGGTVIRHHRARGPAAARNNGWATASTGLVAFVDADCEPSPGWLTALLPHFDDPAVAAVAPRVTSRPDPALPPALAIYEAQRGPLDRGARPAIVRPLSPVPYVPTAALVVRRAALEQVGGFDEALRFGEDVDLVWRLGAAGHTVRYEPATTVTHPTRRSAPAWARQRFDYGTSAAPLARRHGKAVAPLRLSGWSAAAWALVLAGRPVAGLSVAAVSTALLGPRLSGLEHPWREAVRLAGGGNAYAGRYVADALTRSWWPLALTTGVLWRRSRPALVAAFTVPALAEWVAERPPIGPGRWVAMRLADDLCYGAGVWAGTIRGRTAAALRPDLVSWPGRAQTPSTETNDTISPG